MRTHLGNPSQTFAALEQTLHGLLSKLTPVSSDPSSVVADTVMSAPQLYSVPAARTSSEAPLLEPAWMMLEMMHALEKNMYSAYAGSCMRPAGYVSAAIAFYKSNRKVCFLCIACAGQFCEPMRTLCVYFGMHMLLGLLGVHLQTETWTF